MFRNSRLACAALVALATFAAEPAGALPLISEVYYDATGSDDGKSFIELYGAPGTSLDGLVLEGINGSNGAAGPTLALTGVLPDDGFFVVADARADGSSDVAGADLLLNFDLQNGPDSVLLRTAQAEVLDAVGYGEFAPEEFFAGEGAPAPDAPVDAGIARVFANVDSGDNAADFAVAAPTPGSGALQPVPEPGSGGLAAAGLAVWAGARRVRRARS